MGLLDVASILAINESLDDSKGSILVKFQNDFQLVGKLAIVAPNYSLIAQKGDPTKAVLPLSKGEKEGRQ